MYKLLIFLLIPFVIPNQAIAQEVWTLDRCINEAVQNNLQLKQSDLMIRRMLLVIPRLRREDFLILMVQLPFMRVLDDR
ncbi:MAG: hypothetical protein IPL13_17495 [Saprospiraceae bacterium]|nr:hypothetical protein [Candidatus Brachybacter algidus]